MSAFRKAVRAGWSVIEIKHTMGQSNHYNDQDIIQHRERIVWGVSNAAHKKFLVSITKTSFRYAFKDDTIATMFRLKWL